jgi:hypothetical protein
LAGSFGPSLRSGFRLRAPAALTPATRLNFNHSRTCPRPQNPVSFGSEAELFVYE